MTYIHNLQLRFCNTFSTISLSYNDKDQQIRRVLFAINYLRAVMMGQFANPRQGIVSCWLSSAARPSLLSNLSSI